MEIKGNTTLKKTGIFAIFLILFSVAMALAIFLKQRPVTPGIVFTDVVIWQLVLWVPLVLTIPLLEKAARSNSPVRWVLTGLFILMLHYLWFAGMSSLISPYIPYPRTRYGVYPFFFIFWTLIDVFLISGLLLYLVSRKKKEQQQVSDTDPVLYLKQGKKAVLLKPEEIYWIGAEDYYSDIHSSRGRFLERQPLKDLLALLPSDRFMRIHRSTVINLKAVEEFRQISALKAEVKLQDGSTRLVSRTHIKPLRDRLKEV